MSSEQASFCKKKRQLNLVKALPKKKIPKISYWCVYLQYKVQKHFHAVASVILFSGYRSRIPYIKPYKRYFGCNRNFALNRTEGKIGCDSDNV